MKQMHENNERKNDASAGATNPDWGPHPPRRFWKALSIHNHMSTSVGMAKDAKGAGPWFTSEQIRVWYNENYRYDITPNWLGNVLAKNKGAFEKGPNRYVANNGRGGATKLVALWMAI